MGFLSRKKPKPAPVEIQEEQPIVDELQEMEELVPERSVEEPTLVHEPVAPAVEEVAEEPEPALNAAEPEPEVVASEPEPEVEDEDDGRMRAVDLIAPTRLDFLAEKEAAEERPVKTAEVFVFANQKGGV